MSGGPGARDTVLSLPQLSVNECERMASSLSTDPADLYLLKAALSSGLSLGCVHIMLSLIICLGTDLGKKLPYLRNSKL